MNAGRKEAESEGSHVAPPEMDAGTLASKPRDDVQINRNGLN